MSLSLVPCPFLDLGQHLLALGSSAYEQSCLRVETTEDFRPFICGHIRCLPLLQLRFSYLLFPSFPFPPSPSFPPNVPPFFCCWGAHWHLWCRYFFFHKRLYPLSVPSKSTWKAVKNHAKTTVSVANRCGYRWNLRDEDFSRVSSRSPSPLSSSSASAPQAIDPITLSEDRGRLPLPFKSWSTVCVLQSRVRGRRVKGETTWRGADCRAVVARLALWPSIRKTAGVGTGQLTTVHDTQSLSSWGGLDW